MEERRKLQRFDLKLPAEIRVVHPDEGEERLESVTANICSGGAFFDTAYPLPRGTRVRVGLSVPFRRLTGATGRQGYLRIQGVVIRSERSGMAIQFEEDFHLTVH